MKLEVPVDIVAQATECTRNYACLKGDGHSCCPVVETIGSEVHFVEPKANAFCDYRLAFGGGSICTCPVRKHLHQKHGV